MLSANLFTQKKVAQHVPSSNENGKGTDATDAPHEATEELGWLGSSYERLLTWTLRHRWAPMALTLAILVISVFFATGLRISFLPAQVSDTFGLGFQLPPGASLDATDRLSRQAEAIIEKDRLS